MIDSCNIFGNVEPDEIVTANISKPICDEIHTYNNSKGTTENYKRHLPAGRLIINDAVITNREKNVVSENRFVNIASLAYLMYAETNEATVGPQSIRRAFNNLQIQLVREGINFDVFNAKISRLDLTLTLKVTRPVHYYFPLLRAIQPKGFEKHEHDGTNLTFRKSNENSIIIYDKVEQLTKIKHMPEAQIRARCGLKKNEHLLRFEHQFRRARQVQKHLGVTTVANLLTNQKALATFIKDEFRNMLGNIDKKHRKLANQNISERSVLSNFIQGNETLYYHFGLLKTCNYNPEEALKLICQTEGRNYQRFTHRTRQKLHEALQLHKTLMKLKNADSYEEIYEAINKPIWL